MPTGAELRGLASEPSGQVARTISVSETSGWSCTCGKSYSLKDSLKRHQKKSKDCRPKNEDEAKAKGALECTCGKTYSNQGNLNLIVLRQ